MRRIKFLIYKLFGLKTYLRIVSRTYIRLISLGYGKSQYPEIHFLKNIIRPGFFCIDIGANLGYFSYFLSKYVGKNGKVYAVEPVPLFGEIWKSNVTRTSMNNAELLPYALGGEESMVQMGMPVVEGTVHHGMTKVIENSENTYEQTFEVSMKIPDELFKDVERIDFLKIDVEGYEHNVFANMRQTLAKHHPMIQAELGGEENRKECFAILSELGYKPNTIVNGRLQEIPLSEINTHGQDFYFV